MIGRGYGTATFAKALRSSFLVFTLAAISLAFEMARSEPADVPNKQVEPTGRVVPETAPSTVGRSFEERDWKVWISVGGLGLIVVGAGVMFLQGFLHRRGPRWARDAGKPPNPIAVSLTLPQILRIELATKTEPRSDAAIAGRVEGLEANLKNILLELRTLGDELSRLKGEQSEPRVAGRTSPPSGTFVEPAFAGKETLPETKPVDNDILLIERLGSEPSRGYYSIQLTDTIEGKSRLSGDLVTVMQIEESYWEVYGIERYNFDTILNNLFVLTEQGGVIKSTIKPATIMGKREGHTIIVQELAKGTLETGRPA